MAQLRQDFVEFTKRNAVIMVIGPENSQSFRKYWQENNLPFIGIPDPNYQVLKLYGQEVNLFKLGRMPAQVLVDAEGITRYVHYGHSMSDIPENQELFYLLDTL
jgi:peroxiredoxin